MAPMTKIAPIIMNFFRASYICISKYILTQEHDHETFSSFVHPYYIWTHIGMVTEMSLGRHMLAPEMRMTDLTDGRADGTSPKDA